MPFAQQLVNQYTAGPIESRKLLGPVILVDVVVALLVMAKLLSFVTVLLLLKRLLTVQL